MPRKLKAEAVRFQKGSDLYVVRFPLVIQKCIKWNGL